MPDQIDALLREPKGRDLRFVLAIARQDPFAVGAGPDGRACNWCDGVHRGQDMPHERGCIWVLAAAKRTDWVVEIQRQTGAGKMDATRALERYADVGRAVAFIEGASLHRADPAAATDRKTPSRADPWSVRLGNFGRRTEEELANAKLSLLGDFDQHYGLTGVWSRGLEIDDLVAFTIDDTGDVLFALERHVPTDAVRYVSR